MKKIILLTWLSGCIAIATFAQSQKLNRTNTKKKTADTVVLPTIQREANYSGANGIDGSINDANNSGANKSSTIAPADTTRRR